MKDYQVVMYNASTAPLSVDTDPPAALENKEFDTEQDAIDFATSQKNLWNVVKVEKGESSELILAFKDGQKYSGEELKFF